MSTDVQLKEDQLRVLRIIARSEKQTVDHLVQEAVASYIEARRKDKQRAFDEGYGLWGEGEDGLAYQERLRGEW